MKTILSFLLVMIFTQNFSQTKIAKADLVNNYVKDTILVTYPKTQNTKIPKFWRDKNSIQTKWIHIEKDIQGYVNYDPCDGSAEEIEIKNNYIKIDWRYEEPETYKIVTLEFNDKNKKFIFVAKNVRYRQRIKGSAKIIDSEKGVVKWEIDDFKWLTVPLAKIAEYRKIENVCINNKRKELKFLPIETE